MTPPRRTRENQVPDDLRNLKLDDPPEDLTGLSDDHEDQHPADGSAGTMGKG